jgi:hypothetical protein
MHGVIGRHVHNQRDGGSLTDVPSHGSGAQAHVCALEQRRCRHASLLRIVLKNKSDGK